MASIDERVVAMSFENTKFEAGIAKTSASLTKFNSLLASVGTTHGFANIEKAANKVTLTAPNTALDKLRAKLGGASTGAAEGFSGIERAGNKVSLEAPSSALDRLRAKLGGVGAGASEGFNDITKASQKVSFGGLSSSIDSVTAKFSGMTVAFSSALGTMVSTATLKGQEIAKSLTLGPLTQGLEEYATNLNSIQTILANTEQSGAKLQDVNKALQILNTYSDQTIYNFSQMAKGIGTFTAAGVDLKTATASIKGIANLAALSGSNNEQATRTMQQLSQAISSGKVSLEDWNSVVNAGMGGVKFQSALLRTAQNMGALSKEAVVIKDKMGNATVNGESFRNSIMAKPGEESWLSSKVLTQTLQQFTGDMTDAELASQGFTKAQIKSIQQTAETAKNAATEVKTLKGVMDVAKESIASGWAKSFELVFGNFEEAKKTFTALSGAIGDFLGGIADARNKVLGVWKELGGREELIKGIKAAFDALMSVLKPIQEAFRDIFPAKTGKDLFELTKRFRELMENLKIGPETADLLKRTFKGFFAILSIGKTVISGIARVFFNLLGVVGKSSGGFLGITATIGDFLVALDKAISQGKGLEGVFKALENVLRGPIEVIKAVASALASLFGGSTSQDKLQAMEKGTDALGRLKEALGPLAGILDGVIRVWEKFFEVLGDVAAFLEPIMITIKDAFAKVGDFIIQGLKEVDYNSIMTFIQTTFIGGLAIGIKKLLGGIGIDLTGGLVDNLKKVTGTLTSTLTTIQKNINARTMLLIAAAVLALALAATVFAQIDAKALGKAMGAITVGIAQLSGAMLALTKVAKGGAFLALPFIATAMVLLAGSMIVLSGAVKILSTMSWEEIAKGLSGVAGGLLAMAVASRFMGPALILAGPGLVFVAGAMLLLGAAMKIFGEMDWEQIAKGLVAIGGALLVIGLATKALGPMLLLVGPGLILAAVGLILLSGAVSSFGNMDLSTIAKGIVAIGAALLIIGLAISAIPPTIAIQAAGLLILAVALTGISAAVGILGKMDMSTLAKGILAIAGVLLVFAVGLTAMAATIPGSLALLAAAAALAILTPVLVTLGSLSWGTILKGLAALALTLGVIAVVGALAAPSLTALGVALLLVGGAVLLVGGGVYLLAKAFTLLGEEGTKGVGIMVAAITAFIALIPKMVIEFLKGLADILTSLVELAPKIAENLVKIIGTILNGLVDLLPKMRVTIEAVIDMLLQVLVEKAPLVFDAGMKLLLHFLRGIDENIGKVTERVSSIIQKFLNKMTEEAPKLAKSGADFLVAWLKGIANNVQRVINAAATVLTNFINSIANNLPRVYASGVRVILRFIKSVTDAVPKIIKAGVSLVLAIMQGIGDAIPRLVKKGLFVAQRFLNGVADGLSGLAHIGFRAIIRFLNGLEKAIRENFDELFEAGAGVADAIIDGLIDQFGKLGPVLRKALEQVFQLLPGWAKKILGISSPSKVFMEIGKNVMLGMSVGLERGGANVVSTMQTTVEDIVDKTERALASVPDILGGMSEFNPVITPVLDLTAIEKDAKALADLTNVTPITAAASFGQASAISEEQQVSEAAQAEAAADAASNVFSFEQNNYSPESLSDIEIYRQTRNQLAQAKSILDVP